MVNVHYKIKYYVKFLVDSACTQLHSIIEQLHDDDI